MDAISFDLAQTIREFIKVWGELERRKLDLLEQQIEIQKAPLKPNKPKEAMPHDVWALCNNYSDEWAREDALKQAHEWYDEFDGNWDRVRERLSIKVE